MPNKARHLCDCRRDGEAAVSRENAALATFFRILLGIDEDRRQGEDTPAVAAVKEGIRTRWPHSDPMSH